MGKPLLLTDAPVLPPVPGWLRSRQGEGLAEAAFRAGSALAHLHVLSAVEAVPQALWRDRMAFRAAEVCARMAGRREAGRELRDSLHLLRAGDDPGPAGIILRQWSRAAARPVSAEHLVRVLDGFGAVRVGDVLQAQGDTPVDRAAAALEAVLTDAPRAETAALILAEAVLARGTGQGHLLPVLTQGLGPRDLRLRGDALRLACHRAVAAGAVQAVPVAGDLARRAARLRAVAPMLRAKTAGRAVEMFLSRDAMAPAALDFMSDRAARRLCDRLVELGALRELTGRDVFRLYGL